MAVAIPSAIQVFAWIATLRKGRVQLNSVSLFLLGFLFIFVLGGLTGVMVAVQPFDTQVHDTYFIVAHLHYVLIGGMLFPVFAGMYHWGPLVNGHQFCERLAKWTFGLMFVGFNLAFFPMHASGLLGMPRRVATYASDAALNLLNMLSSVGAFVFASRCSWSMLHAPGPARSRRTATRGKRRRSSGCRTKASARAASLRWTRKIRCGSGLRCTRKCRPANIGCPAPVRAVARR
jgi:heme/copper-type cytochrome/quinol oxidase subunit 1